MVQPPFQLSTGSASAMAQGISVPISCIWSTGSTRGHTSIGLLRCALRLLLRHHTLPKVECVRAHRRRTRSRRSFHSILNHEEIVRFLEAVGGIAQSCCVDDGLCGGIAHRGGRAPEDRFERQRTDVAAHRRRQEIGRDRYAMLSPRLLKILRAYWKRARPSSVAVSGPGARRTCEPRRSSVGLSRRKAACPDRQACELAPLA